MKHEQNREGDHVNDRSRSWEQMGAASGLFAALLFAVAFIVFLSTDPGGGNTPQLPDIANAQAAHAFFADHLNAIRAQVMLNSIGIVFFLWFLGTLWTVAAEGRGGARPGLSDRAAGALAGVALTLVGLSPAPPRSRLASPRPRRSRPSYTAAAVLVRLRRRRVRDLLRRDREVSLQGGRLAELARLPGAARGRCFGLRFVTPYSISGIFNPATGALGLYAQ